MKISLGLTHRCNLACAYCYAGKASPGDMAFETAKKAVDFALEQAHQEEALEFNFFGGEPLLCFEAIQSITSYIRAKTTPEARQVRLSMTTNGTLLTKPILEFIASEAIDICISIDGPQHVHDKYRVFPGGRGSLATVVRNLQTALDQLDFVQVNAVYSPDTAHSLPETIRFLVALGATVIHLNPNIYGTWSTDELIDLRRIFLEIADFYIQAYRSQKPIAVSFLDSKILLFLKGGYTPADLCGMAQSQWAFAPSGNIYPCERLIGEDNTPDMILGNVHSQLDQARRCQLLSNLGNRNVTCKQCEWRAYCMNWCGCTNYFMTGKTNLCGPVLCAIEKASIAAARHAYLTLIEEENELFVDHLMSYLCEGRHTIRQM